MPEPTMLKSSTIKHRANRIGAKIAALRKERDELWRRCPHTDDDLSYSPDPAGGSGSGWACSACGAWFRYKPGSGDR